MEHFNYYYVVVIATLKDGHNATVALNCRLEYELDTAENIERLKSNIIDEYDYSNAVITNIIPLKGL